MTESLEREIRTLRELYWSDRDPDGRAFATLADAYRRSGDIRQAIELVNEGLERLPDFASGHVVAARLYCDAGMMEEASLAARRALDLDQENVEALRSLARSLEARGDVLEAAQLRGRADDLESTGEEDGGLETSQAMAAGTEREAGDEAPPEGGEEPVSLADLAPDEEEPVSLADLAPDPEDPVPLAELAPDDGDAAPEDEDVVPLADLAPDEAVEEPVPLTDLAPDTEEVVSLADLAPDEEEVSPRGGPTPGEGEDPVSLEELAPEAEEVVSLAELAPEEDSSSPDELGGEEAGERVVSLDDLAPEEPSAEEVAAFTPSERLPAEEGVGVDGEPAGTAPEDEPTGSLDELGPAEDEGGAAAEGSVVEAEGGPLAEPAATRAVQESGEPVPEAGAEAEEEPAPATAGPEPAAVSDGPSEVPDEGGPSSNDPLPTRTLADLYARQGLTDRALSVYRRLLEVTPGDAYLQERVAALSSAAEGHEPDRSAVGGESPAPADEAPAPEGAAPAEPPTAEDEAERDLAAVAEAGWDRDEQPADEEVDTPFAWTEEVEEVGAGEEAGPPVSEYFRRMLAWGGEDAGDDEDAE